MSRTMPSHTHTSSSVVIGVDSRTAAGHTVDTDHHGGMSWQTAHAEPTIASRGPLWALKVMSGDPRITTTPKVLNTKR
jgi:hypothetical protein